MQKWMLLMPLALMACGDKTEDTAGEEGETVTVEPQEGGWTMTDLEFTTDTCGMDEGDTGSSEPEPAALNLTANADGSYTLVLDDEISLTCNMSGADFACDPLSMTEEDQDPNMVLTQTITINAVFSSNTAFNGDVGMEMSCEGSDCAMLAEFGMTMPCSMEGTFAATANEQYSINIQIVGAHL